MRHRPCCWRPGGGRLPTAFALTGFGGPGPAARDLLPPLGHHNAEGTARRSAQPFSSAHLPFREDAAPFGAPSRFSLQPRKAATQLQAAFPGTWPWRALSASAYPSPASFSRSGHNAARAEPRSRPGARVRAPPAGAAHARPGFPGPARNAPVAVLRHHPHPACSVFGTSPEDALGTSKARWNKFL
jgi:hypothetical protein